MNGPLVQALLDSPDDDGKVWRLGTVTQVSPLLVKLGAATTGQPCRSAVEVGLAVNDFVVVLLNGPDRIVIARESVRTSNKKIAFVPPWSGTLGNGNFGGSYYSVDSDWCNVHIEQAWGTTTSHGAGAVQNWTLPIAPAVGGNSVCGSSYLLDSNVSGEYARHAMVDTSKVYVLSDGASTFVRGNAPFTFGNGDRIRIDVSYPI